MKEDLLIISNSPEDTKFIGAEFGKRLFSGAIVAISGDLGSGKTCFVEGIVDGFYDGAKYWAGSPSFTIINEYKGEISLFHIDLYRIKKIEELEEIGYIDYIYGEGVAIIEWADRFPEILPDERVEIEMEYIQDNKRKIKIKGSGEDHRKLIEKIKKIRFGV